MAVTASDFDPNPGASGKNGVGRTVSAANSLKEAREHLLKAERNTKPNLSRWKPKLSVAGDEYCRAAILFYQAGEVEASKANLLKACECFKKKRAWYSAAKTLEQATAITHKQGDLNMMTELAWRSAALFRKAGQPDSAAQLLERASRALEENNPEGAKLMLEKAAETVETENRPIQAAAYMNKILRMCLVKNTDDDEEAIKRARKLVELYQEAGHKPSCGRAVLGLIVLLLHAHRSNEADIIAREFGNNCSPEQNVIIEDLLDAFDQNDSKKVSEALKSKALTALDPEFNKVFSTLTLPPETLNQGTRPRTRTRRNFSISVPKSDKSEPNTVEAAQVIPEKTATSVDEKTEEKNVLTDPNAARVTDGLKGIEKVEESKTKEPKPDEERAKQAEEILKQLQEQTKSSKIPARKKTPLVKMKTLATGYDGNTPNKAKTNKKEPSAYIDVTTDSLERHRPSHLPEPAPYIDVTGIDPIQPAYMGMTAEQWRAFKRSQATEEQDYGVGDGLADISEDYVGGGDDEW